MRRELETLFRSFIYAYDSANRLADPLAYSNTKKHLEGIYRRLQAEKYQNAGVLLYYHLQVERLHRCLQLEQRGAIRDARLNPYIQRYQNFEGNSLRRGKVDMREFLGG